MIEIRIPTPGESINEVELASWFVQDGDIVKKDQEIAEIESDKATLTLVAFEGGKIHILIPEGKTVGVGEVACTIDTSATQESYSEKTSDKDQKIHQEEPSASTEEKADDKTKDKEQPIQEPHSSQKYEKVKISPMAKRLMDDHNLSVEEVVDGLRRLSSKDVKKVVELIEEEKASPYLPATTYPYIPRQEERKKMTSLRRKLSQRLVKVKNETAMLTTFNEVDMSTVIELRKKYQSDFREKHNIKLGFMSFFTKAVTEALKLYPMVNSMIDGDEIVTPNYADIGIAVQTPKGLMVPVIRNAESLSLSKIEKRLSDLAIKARSGKISLDDLLGGSFTITNGGIFGSMLSTPILNPPQSGILGMHNIVERPVAINGKVDIRPIMYVALSYDHRIIDGKDSVGFLLKVKELIEQPHKMLFRDQDPDQMLLDL